MTSNFFCANNIFCLQHAINCCFNELKITWTIQQVNRFFKQIFSKCLSYVCQITMDGIFFQGNMYSSTLLLTKASKYDGSHYSTSYFSSIISIPTDSSHLGVSSRRTENTVNDLSIIFEGHGKSSGK